MFTIEDNKIKLTRGDTLTAQIALTKNGATYTPVEGDKIMFYLKRNLMDIPRSRFIQEEPSIEKEVDIDTLVLTIEPDDTKDLRFGEYVYDLEITFANGEVDTFVNDEQFEILPEVG